MSDRMPEDLPVRKCINVMVGITRSIFFYSFLLLQLDKQMIRSVVWVRWIRQFCLFIFLHWPNNEILKEIASISCYQRSL